MKAALSDPNVTQDKVQDILDDRIDQMMNTRSVSDNYSRSQLRQAQTYWVKYNAWQYGQKTEQRNIAYEEEDSPPQQHEMPAVTQEDGQNVLPPGITMQEAETLKPMLFPEEAIREELKDPRVSQDII